jgi:phage shock protein A
MSSFKRLKSTFVAQVDRFVAQVENHEAVVDGALSEMRAGLARARVQLGRVEHDGKRMRQQLAEHEGDVQRWRDRAAECADDERAMECLRRRKRSQQMVSELTERVSRHETTERALRGDVERLREHFDRLGTERNLMRSREARARAAAAVAAEGDAGLEIGTLFERWETRVAEAELLGGVGDHDGRDALLASFESAEEEAELRAELQALRGAS